MFNQIKRGRICRWKCKWIWLCVVYLGTTLKQHSSPRLFFIKRQHEIILWSDKISQIECRHENAICSCFPSWLNFIFFVALFLQRIVFTQRISKSIVTEGNHSSTAAALSFVEWFQLMGWPGQAINSTVLWQFWLRFWGLWTGNLLRIAANCVVVRILNICFGRFLQFS